MADVQEQDLADQRNIKPFYALLSDLSKEMMNHELKDVVLLCRGKDIPKSKMTPNEPGEFLMTLDEHGVIGEDNTFFLKELLGKSGCNVGKILVENYEKERQEHLKHVEILLGSKDPFFVGRTAFVSKILEVFRDHSHTKCRCVLVYGLAGTGKTKLAAESCAIYKAQVQSGPRLFRVNLRKATKVDEVGLWMLNSVTGKRIAQNQFDMMLVKSWIRKCSQDTIILLDNADDILNPSSYSRDHFVNTLTDLLSLTNHLVKILLTSRHPIDYMGLRDAPNFLELKLEPLQVNESLILLSKMVNRARDFSGMASVGGEGLVDEESLIEIAKLCGNNPQALRAVASRLSTGFSPKSLVEALKSPEQAYRVLDPGSLGTSAAVQDERRDFEDQPLVLSSLSAMYEQLPLNLKEALLRLSVFPSSFSLSQGAMILGKERPDDARFDLEDLKKWSLLERDLFDVLDTGLSEDEPYYYIHPLVRSVSLSMIGTSEVYKVSYEDALRRFLSYIADFLKDLTQLGHRDFTRALATFETEKTNVIHFLELGMGHKFGCQVIAQKEQEDSVPSIPLPDNKEGLFSIFETFLDPSKRLEFYESMSMKRQSRGDPIGWAYLQAWVADELYASAKYDQSWKTVESALKVLQLRESDTGARTNDLERAEAQLYYVKGRIIVARQNYKDGIAILEKSLMLQQRLLGDHSVTARCLNSLAHAYFNMADATRHSSVVTKAHDYHFQAWEVLKRITGNKPEKHFDAPMYLMNIGSTYHLMGKKSKRSDKKKAEKYFHLAIKNYQEAHELERALKLSNSPNTAYILKNMAMSYCEMENYEKALPLAIDAVDIRLDTIGVHPTTARNLFFIGSLYDSMGDKYTTSKKPEDKDKSVENFNHALEYYNQAFRMEVKLGSSRSIEYDDLKEDLKELLRKLHMDKELDNYRRMFKMADEGTPDLKDMSALFVSGSPNRSQSRKRSQEEMGAEDMPVGEGEDQGEAETAGPSRRRPPGPVFFDESDEKSGKRKCNLS